MTSTSEKNLWHRRLGHMSAGIGKYLYNNVEGMNNSEEHKKWKGCDTCLTYKSTANRRPREARRRAKKYLERVHMDLNGPFRTIGKGDVRYILNLVDDHSREVHLYTLKRKSETISKFEEFIRTVGTPQIIRTDNGSEFISKEWMTLLKKYNIKVERSCAYAQYLIL